MNPKRRLILALGVAYLGAARAQGRTWRIAWLNAGSIGRQGALFDAFREGLSELGYVEGRNIVIDARWADGKSEDIPRLAAELIALHPDVIVTAASAPIAAARRATSTIPIVMAQGSNVVGQGFVASLARPGGTVTGISTQFEEIFPKWLEVLHTLVKPGARIGVLGNPGNPMTPTYWSDIQTTARSLETALLQFEARSAFDAAFAAMTKARVGALMVLPDPVFVDQRAAIVALAARHSLPAMYAYSEFVDSGGLMSYGVNVSQSFRRAAHYVDRILRGAQPATLPVEQAVKLEFVINLKAARALGLAFPSSILLRADRVIE